MQLGMQFNSITPGSEANIPAAYTDITSPYMIYDPDAQNQYYLVTADANMSCLAYFC